MSIRANVDPRRLDQRIRFERKVVQQDPVTLDITETWSLLIECWCAVDGVKASERWRDPDLSGGLQTISDYTVWVRSDIVERFAITEADRAVWGSKAMDIKDVLDQQLRGRMIPLIMQVGANHG